MMASGDDEEPEASLTGPILCHVAEETKTIATDSWMRRFGRLHRGFAKVDLGCNVWVHFSMLMWHCCHYDRWFQKHWQQGWCDCALSSVCSFCAGSKGGAINDIRLYIARLSHSPSEPQPNNSILHINPCMPQSTRKALAVKCS